LIGYADTGFLVSLYGEDEHSSEATALLTRRPVFVLTSLGEAEFTNAIELRIFRKQWTRLEARSVQDLFSQHQAAGMFQMQPLSAEIWDKSLSLSRRHSAYLGTRTLDLLHVAIALTVGVDVFYTFDERQRKLVKAERLRLLPE
jgi:predicted nucleic acid-binding protein